MSRPGHYGCPGCEAFNGGDGLCEFCRRCEELGIVNGSTPRHRKRRRKGVSG